MTNKQLIGYLSVLPMDATIKISCSDGCHECNPEGMPTYYDIDDIPKYTPQGAYPYEKEKHLIIL